VDQLDYPGMFSHAEEGQHTESCEVWVNGQQVTIGGEAPVSSGWNVMSVGMTSFTQDASTAAVLESFGSPRTFELALPGRMTASEKARSTLLEQYLARAKSRLEKNRDTQAMLVSPKTATRSITDERRLARRLSHVAVVPVMKAHTEYDETKNFRRRQSSAITSASASAQRFAAARAAHAAKNELRLQEEAAELAAAAAAAEVEAEKRRLAIEKDRLNDLTIELHGIIAAAVDPTRLAIGRYRPKRLDSGILDDLAVSFSVLAPSLSEMVPVQKFDDDDDSSDEGGSAETGSTDDGSAMLKTQPDRPSSALEDFVGMMSPHTLLRVFDDDAEEENDSVFETVDDHACDEGTTHPALAIRPTHVFAQAQFLFQTSRSTPCRPRAMDTEEPDVPADEKPDQVSEVTFSANWQKRNHQGEGVVSSEGERHDSNMLRLKLADWHGLKLGDSAGLHIELHGCIREDDGVGWRPNDSGCAGAGDMLEEGLVNKPNPPLDALLGGALDVTQFAVEGCLGQRVALPLSSGGSLSCTIRAPMLRLCEFVMDVRRHPEEGFGLTFREAHPEMEQRRTTGAVVLGFMANGSGEMLRAPKSGQMHAVQVGDRLVAIGVAAGEETREGAPEVDIIDTTWANIEQVLDNFPEGGVARMTFRRVEKVDL
jgi:hypothetical protein